MRYLLLLYGAPVRPEEIPPGELEAHMTFTRELTLPAPVDADKVQAKFEHGVLKLTLPKSEAARPRKITVKAESEPAKPATTLP